MPSYGERLGGGAVCPLCRETASSEAEVCCAVEGPEGGPRARRKMSHPLEGRFATLERGGDCPVGLRGVRTGHMLGFFESFPFFRIGSRPWAFVGPVAFTGVCVFKSGLSTPIRVSLIVIPDKHCQDG